MITETKEKIPASEQPDFLTRVTPYLLADGRPLDKKWQEETNNTRLKWQLPLANGSSMLDHTIGVFRELGWSQPNLISRDVAPDVRYRRMVTTKKGSEERLMDKLLLAADDCKTEYLLLSATDMPFLDAPGLRIYIESGLKSNADLTFPVCYLEACEKRAPGMKQSNLPLREGSFTAGNVYLIRTELFKNKENRARIEEALKNRKNKLKLVRQAGGLPLLVRILLASIFKVRGVAPSFDELQALGGRLLNGTVAVVTCYSSLGIDIDNRKRWQAYCNLNKAVDPSS